MPKKVRRPPARGAQWATGRITRAQVQALRKLLEWSGGEGLDTATISALLDEVEWLHAQLAATRRLLEVRRAARPRKPTKRKPPK